jgi:hypothetical protein
VGIGLDGGLAVIKKHRILETVAAVPLLPSAVAVLLYSGMPRRGVLGNLGS